MSTSPPGIPTEDPNDPSAPLRALLQQQPTFSPNALQLLTSGLAGLGTYFGSTDLHGVGDPSKGFSAASQALYTPFEMQTEAWKNKLGAAEQLSKTGIEQKKVGIDQQRADTESKNVESEVTSRTAETQQKKDQLAEDIAQHMKENGFKEEEVKAKLAELGLRTKELDNTLRHQGVEESLASRNADRSDKELQFNKEKFDYEKNKPNSAEESQLSSISDLRDSANALKQSLADPNIAAKLDSFGGRLSGVMNGNKYAQVLAADQDGDMRDLGQRLLSLQSQIPLSLGIHARGAEAIKLFGSNFSAAQSKQMLLASLDAALSDSNRSEKAIQDRIKERASSTGGKPIESKSDKKEEPKKSGFHWEEDPKNPGSVIKVPN